VPAVTTSVASAFRQQPSARHPLLKWQRLAALGRYSPSFSPMHDLRCYLAERMADMRNLFDKRRSC